MCPSMTATPSVPVLSIYTIFLKFFVLFSKSKKQGDALCKDCFYVTFETEVHHTIISNKLFTKGQVVAIGASGGKGNNSQSATDV